MAMLQATILYVFGNYGYGWGNVIRDGSQRLHLSNQRGYT